MKKWKIWLLAAAFSATMWIIIGYGVKEALAHPGTRQANSTAYCLRGTMANGSSTRAGSVAMNNLRLGTKITVNRSPTGRRHFVVRDRIGNGTQLDFWVSSCSAARYWGRRNVGYRIGWH